MDTKLICDGCGKEVIKLHEVTLNNDDTYNWCEDCYGKAEARADIEYERRKENGY